MEPICGDGGSGTKLTWTWALSLPHTTSTPPYLILNEIFYIEHQSYLTLSYLVTGIDCSTP